MVIVFELNARTEVRGHKSQPIPPAEQPLTDDPATGEAIEAVSSSVQSYYTPVGLTLIHCELDLELEKR